MTWLNEIRSESKDIWNDQAAFLFLKQYVGEDPSHVALKLQNLPIQLRTFIVEQIKGRIKGKKKFPSYANKEAFVYPNSESIEQTSSELTAIYKSSLTKGKSFVDLSAGMGVDSFFFRKSFEEAILVEPNLGLLERTKHNFDLHKVNSVKFYHGKAEDFLNEFNENVDCIFIDPSRRKNGNRYFTLEQCEPNILALLEKMLSITNLIIVKFSPMADVQYLLKSIPNTTDIHILSWKGECREILLEIKKSEEFSGIIKAVDLDEGSQTTFEYSIDVENQLDVEVSDMNKYAFIPNPAVIKSGGFKSLCDQFNLKKISKNTHIYTSSSDIPNFPGRRFKVEKTIKYGTNSSQFLEDNGYIIMLRNFSDDVKGIMKKLRITDHGEKYLLAYRNQFNKSEITIGRHIQSE